MRRYLYFVTFVAALGGLMFGFETAVINGAIYYVAEHFQLSEFMKGFVVSTALAGCVIGALFIGKPGDKYGRRYMLKIMAALFLFSMLGAGLAANIWMFVIARFLGGIAVGGASVLTPMYISEVSPPKIRGKLVATNQLAIVTGILVAFFSDYMIDSLLHGSWRWMFLAGVVPSAVLWVLLFFISRSPRWLVKIGKNEEAREVIKRVNPEEDADLLMTSIKDSLKEEAANKRVSLMKKPYLRLAIIGIAVGMFNQLAGINVIMYYSTDIFRQAGFSGEAALFQSVLIGLTNLIFTIVAMSIIDRFGRKFLLYVGASGMSVFLGLFSWAFITDTKSGFILLSLLIGYIAFFAFSQGAVIWVILSEMFPNSVRAKGTAMGSFSHWIFNFAIALLFPVVSSMIGVGYVFVFFTVATLLSLLFYRFALIETKGKSLEEIEKLILKK
ncbi:sugar porter family MFS transporter [Maribellus comscasis]|uniref:Sugar porter family MFS transporter n=1 Tax=Maribellus comscasis TaxID=2681766 RepID=A0A6I6JW88_9BACT|nr:sugar porter family MFS transporter [Maribellus comscasis]QGY47396.1 sugar porter family MFS transporter [Maribellus comscasis]